MHNTKPDSWLERLKNAAVAPLVGTRKARRAPLVAATLAATSLFGCLDRPIGEDGPRTTNILVNLLNQSVVDKIDLLFVIDNSLSMADKQSILGEAVPELLSRFVTPVCLNLEGGEVPRQGDDCPPGSSPEFNAIEDINIGIITTSLGGYGAEGACEEEAGKPFTQQRVDMAHLVGSLPRAAGAGGAFLAWRGGGEMERNDLEVNFTNQVKAAGEQGCGFEAPLEAWVRFLVDPHPYTTIVKRPCPGASGSICNGPELNGDAQAIDDTILTQRKEFMRMDSLLAVIMLTDENDCSFKASGQSYMMLENSPAYRASTQCESDPNDACCQTCGAGALANCPSEGGKALGCSEGDGTYGSLPNDETQPHWDDLNVRCFKQKERFGLDFLYPVERYANALTLRQICPFADDLNPQSSRCASGGVVSNPVFVRGDESRPESLVFLGGIVGVPWQDLAQDPNADVLRFRKAVQDDNDSTGQTLINWDWLLGPADADGNRALYPKNDGVIDPLMYESIDPRTGTNPAIQAALAPPGSEHLANPINGHEWNVYNRGDLQYACIFPLPDGTEDCPTDEEAEAARNDPATFETGVPNCDCTHYGGDLASNPLCQNPNTDEFDMTQRYAKAYPSVRPLQALEMFARKHPQSNAIVASICPKEVSDNTLPDYGYNPAVATIVDRLKEQLQEPCLPRPLGTKDDGSAACIIMEAVADPNGCDTSRGYRLAVDDPGMVEKVNERLKEDDICGTAGGRPCGDYKVCEIPQVEPDQNEYAACITGGGGAGNGWCYVDADKIPDTVSRESVEAVLEKCPDTQKRKIRFVGEGQAGSNAYTFYACAGALFDE